MALSFDASSTSHILSKIEGRAGVITLNRPQARNALSLPMVREITRLLHVWKDDPQICLVIVQSGHGKVFCAGGDIRSVYDAHHQNGHEFIAAFFEEEYLLNFTISQYPKPYLALMDGMAMGGGLGLAVHGSHRVVTERTVMAMPEVAIGFFPDVGAGYFLNQCPGGTGTYLGILGVSIRADDALYTGLATHYLAAEDLPRVYRVLIEARCKDEVNAILQDAVGGQQDCFLQTHRDMIDHCFSFPTVEEIICALEKEPNALAQEWIKDIQKKSPTSLKLVLALLRRARGLSLKEVLSLDFRLSQHCIHNPDFMEGVRAVLVDKDHHPRWNPPHLHKVTQEAIDRYFL